MPVHYYTGICEADLLANLILALLGYHLINQWLDLK